MPLRAAADQSGQSAVNRTARRRDFTIVNMTRTPDRIEDELLVFAAQDGDGRALEQLVTRWNRGLWRHARRLTGDADAASEAVQEAWLSIVKGLRKLHDPACFPAWALRIVTNKCADWTRRQVAQRKMAQALEDTPTFVERKSSADFEAESEQDRVAAAISKLPEEQRAILSLHYLEGLRVRQIAEVLGVPAGTVKSRLFYARNRLREALERVKT